MGGSDPKLSARELLEEAHPALVGLSHWIHANPELGYQETLASGWVAEWLTTGGFEVESGYAGMPTAVIGHSGPGPFHVAICVEYDALPGVGHACGHNVIAAAGVGAGLALASVADELGLRITVMGTPAEETGGGKLRFIDAGAFDGVHAAMMVHPWPTDVARPRIIAVNQLEVSYTGQEAHAAGFPHLGRNAADALVIAQTAIGLLRQQLLPTDRVHGIVTKGGDAPNIIPAHTSALYMVRAQDRERLAHVIAQVRRCFEAGALATGTEVEVVEGTAYADLVHDPDLSALYRNNAERLGRVFDDSDGAPVSTDMGDVSHVLPTIHPMLGIDSDGAVNHQAAFTAACATPSADQAILDGATALAWTVIDAVQDEVVRARLMGVALARDAEELVGQAALLEAEADELAAAARSSAPVDAGAAEELAVASAALDAEARDLLAEAEARLDVADALTDAAVRDEVANDLASDADDLRYQAGAMHEAADELADDVHDDLATADTLEARAVELASQARQTEDGPSEDLALAAAHLQDTADALRDDAELRAAEAAALAGNAEFVRAASEGLTEEADAISAVDEPAFGWLEPRPEAAAEASDTAPGEAAWGSVAASAAQEAADLDADADRLATEAADLAMTSTELSEHVEDLSGLALAAADQDPDAAEVYADAAYQLDTQAEATADAAEWTFQGALDAEARAQAADDLAEVATDAVEDESAATPGSASVQQEPLPGNASGAMDMAAWDALFSELGAGPGPDADVPDGESQPEVPLSSVEDLLHDEDAWYTGAEPEALAEPEPEPEAPAEPEPEPEAPAQPEPGSPFADFRWIPGGPED